MTVDKNDDSIFRPRFSCFLYRFIHFEILGLELETLKWNHPVREDEYCTRKSVSEVVYVLYIATLAPFERCYLFVVFLVSCEIRFQFKLSEYRTNGNITSIRQGLRQMANSCGRHSRQCQLCHIQPAT